MAKRKSGGHKEVEINEVRFKIRKELIERYGSIAKFLQSKEAAKFGGAKIKVYLYDTGPVSFQVIADLAEWLGIGTLNREVMVTRNYKYFLD